ncbi:MAG: hypothetical protein JW874_05075, partial [Spirochaetales bacterium]|nr:hypothetical protein [Spirochaetales bacterium]
MEFPITAFQRNYVHVYLNSGDAEVPVDAKLMIYSGDTGGKARRLNLFNAKFGRPGDFPAQFPEATAVMINPLYYPYGEIADRAAAAGAAAVLFYSPGEKAFSGTLGQHLPGIPVVGVSCDDIKPVLE